MNKYWKYLNYVLRHKWFVMMECFKHGLIWRGIMHDMSKFRPSEFIPYANFFYGRQQDEKEKDYQTQAAMDKAWLQHIRRNDHHWQHWMLHEDSGDSFCLEMPHKVIVEMMCDWIGAGKAQHSELNCFGWYMQHKHKMKFEKTTQFVLEVLITKYVQSLKKQEEANDGDA